MNTIIKMTVVSIATHYALVGATILTEKAKENYKKYREKYPKKDDQSSDDVNI